MIGIIIALFGTFLFVAGWLLGQRLRRYEFENRSDGGVVGFKTFGASQRHKILLGLANLMKGIGVLIVGGCACFYFLPKLLGPKPH